MPENKELNRSTELRPQAPPTNSGFQQGRLRPDDGQRTQRIPRSTQCRRVQIRSAVQSGQAGKRVKATRAGS